MTPDPKTAPTQSGPTQPTGFDDTPRKKDDAIVNDSLGTVDPADSTGIDEEKETGDAKRNNKPTRED